MIKVLYPFTMSFLDYPDPDSHALVVYFVGCSHTCPGCQNKDLQNPKYNKNVKKFNDDWKLIELICEDSRKFKTKKIVLSGGDPLYSEASREFVRTLLSHKYYFGFEICIYTGFTLEDIDNFGIDDFDFCKCGKYDESLKQRPCKTDNMIRLASKNQVIYDVAWNRVSNDGQYIFNK